MIVSDGSPTRYDKSMTTDEGKSRPCAIFFCKLPPPYNGQNIGTSLVRDLLVDDFEIFCLNHSRGELKPFLPGWNSVKYNISFAQQWVRQYRKLFFLLRKRTVDVFYTIVSPSPLGHLRNIIEIRQSYPHVGRIIAHVRNGNFHNIFEAKWQRWSARFLVKHIDVFIFLSEGLSASAAPHIPASKRVVVPNSIDAAVQCTDEEVRAKLETALRRDRLKILFLSNMIPSKGYMDLAHAVTQMYKTCKLHVEAHFVGSWPDIQDREAFLRHIKAERLEERLIVHNGVTDRSSIKKWLLDADVFVLPTYYPNEAQPRSIIEALNAATPIISTRHAAIPEYIEHGHNGYLVDKHRPDQIAQALLQLSDPSIWREKAIAARETYMNTFSHNAIQRQLKEVFARKL